MPRSIITGHSQSIVGNGRKRDECIEPPPIDNTVIQHQSIHIIDTSGARTVFRLSVTDTEGATLRVDLESYEAAPAKHDQNLQQALAPVIEAAGAVAEIKARTGREGSSVVS